MSVVSRIQEIEGHIGDIYDTLELGGDTTQNKNIVNINNEIKREYKDFLANGTDTLWNNWNKVNGTGESLTLNNTIKGKMKIDLKGNTSQEGTPTPSSPITVNVVSGDNEIVVCDKNVLDTSNTKTSGWNIYGIPNTLKPNTKYTFSIQGTTNYSYSLFTTRDTNSSTTITWLARYYINGGNSVTFTTPADMSNELGLLLGGGQSGASSESIENIKPQIEFGEVKTDYEEHKEQTYPINLGSMELCKIGDYQDYIYKENDKWYKYGAIGKAVLDGTEAGWTRGDTTDSYSYFYTNGLDSLIGTSYNALCNVFNVLPSSMNASTSVSTDTISIGGTSWAKTRIKILTSRLSENSVNGFKTWLSTHNTEVYYVLATPTYTEITDSTLISQLEAIKLSYNEQTNISQTNTDKPFILDVVALGELEI
jgi:hypothetical protein